MANLGAEMHRITLTVKEVSEALGIGINQTYTLIKHDDFPKLKIGTKYVIPKDEFEKWVKIHAYSQEE